MSQGLKIQSIISKLASWVARRLRNLPRAALALPRALTRWANGFFQRLSNEDTIPVLLFCGFSLTILLVPLLGLWIFFQDPPSNKIIYENATRLYNFLSTEVGTAETGATFFWISIAVLMLLIIIPWLARLYVWMLFGAIRLTTVWLLYVVTGYERSAPSSTEATSHVTEQPSVGGANVSLNKSSQEEGTDLIAPRHSGRMDTQLAEKTRPDTNGSQRDLGLEAAKPTQAVSAENPPLAKTDIDEIAEAVDVAHKTMRSRLETMMADFQRREETNLGIGMIFSVLGVIVLAFFVVFAGARKEPDFLSWFTPRISVILFIQLFAYFFLRLYKENLLDIKYFNNEITNMEYKKIAIDIALKPTDPETPLAAKVCQELLNVERNFILRKGEIAADVHGNGKSAPTEGEWKEMTKVMKDIAEHSRKA